MYIMKILYAKYSYIYTCILYMYLSSSSYLKRVNYCTQKKGIELKVHFEMYVRLLYYYEKLFPHE